MSQQHRNTVLGQWYHILQAALDADGWGQTLEANTEYSNLVKRLRDEKLVRIDFNAVERNTLRKIRRCLQHRLSHLQTVELKQDHTFKHTDIQHILPVLQALIDGSTMPQFPIEVDGVQLENENDRALPRNNLSLQAENKTKSANGNLCLKNLSSGTYVHCRVLKIGLKDANIYEQPRVCVSLVDKFGCLVENTQDLTVFKRREELQIIFDSSVSLLTKLEDFKDGYALFFEFKHFKTEKQKLSTRCFSLMEKDEMKENTIIALELYKKPTDFARKRIRLHTVKKLYCYVQLQFLTNR